MKLQSILLESSLEQTGRTLVNNLLNSPVIKKYKLKQLMGIVEEIINTTPKYQNAKYKYIDYPFKRDLTRINRYKRPSEKDVYLFKCKYMSVEEGAINFYGFDEGYGHNVYLKPDDIKEIE